MLEADVQGANVNGLITDLDPLIVTSPIQRSGTTLLQRLLCSASNTLIYGERAAQELEFFLTIHSMKVQEYAFRQQANRQQLDKVLHGDVNDWILDLTPDADGYLLALHKAAFAGVAYCREFARMQARPVWGFKYPAWSPAVLRNLRRLMPRARLLFIARDLIPSLSSAKAQHLMDSEDQLRQLCQSWLAGMAYIHELDGEPQVFSLRYEDLVERPDKNLSAISAFSGAQGMDRAVMQHRINVWAGQEFAAQSRDGYIPPEQLTDRELKVIEEMMATAATPVRG